MTVATPESPVPELGEQLAPTAPAAPVLPPPPPVKGPNKVLVTVLALLGLVATALPFVTPMLLGNLPQQTAGGFGMREATVVRAERGTSVGTSGTIQPAQRLDLSFTSPGEVWSVSVTVGDKVTKGQALATIDPTRLRADVEDARAEANAALKDYEAARKAGSSAQATALRSAYNAKAQALKDARAALDAATLTSAMDGTVAAVNIKVGDRAGAATSAVGGVSVTGGTGTPDIVVISSGTYVVEASVGSADRARVAKGMKATIKAASSPEVLHGTVTSVGVMATVPAGEQQQGSSAATFPVTIAIDGSPANVFAGGSASVEILSEQSRQVLAIPAGALLGGAQGGEADVLVKADGATQSKHVRVGERFGDQIEVLSGLNEGDVVLVMGGVASTGQEKPR